MKIQTSSGQFYLYFLQPLLPFQTKVYWVISVLCSLLKVVVFIVQKERLYIIALTQKRFYRVIWLLLYTSAVLIISRFSIISAFCKKKKRYASRPGFLKGVNTVLTYHFC